MNGNPTYNLAQFNYAVAKDEITSPTMRDFVSDLDRINGLADESPGFVWRLKTEAGNALDIVAFSEDHRRLITLSVWKDFDSFKNFTYNGPHREIMKRRHEWFDHIKEVYLVLWWVPAGEIPTVEDGRNRLIHLRENGSTPFAFTMREHFMPPA